MLWSIWIGFGLYLQKKSIWIWIVLWVVDLDLDCIYVGNYFEYLDLDFSCELCQYLDLDLQVVDLCPSLVVDKGTLSPAHGSATALCELPLGDFCCSGFPKTCCDSSDILAYVRFFSGHFRLSHVIFRLRMTGEQSFIRHTFPLAGHFVRRSRSFSADIFKICSVSGEFREAFSSW